MNSRVSRLVIQQKTFFFSQMKYAPQIEVAKHIIIIFACVHCERKRVTKSLFTVIEYRSDFLHKKIRNLKDIGG